MYEPSQILYTLINKDEITYEKDWIIFNPTETITFVMLTLSIK
ncbi:hypothetical protein RSX31_20255 [Rossellomorea sp. YC4-1]|nr:hypothetical protein [Rossellomorea sp. YC4-1]